VTGNADHRQPPQTISDSDLWRRPWRGCFRLPPRLSIFSFYVYNIGLTSLTSIYSQAPVLCILVLKSNSFTLNFLSLSFLLITDFSCPPEIRTFRCYKGTVHKLRPSPFRFHLCSPESNLLLPKPNSISKLQLVPYSLWTPGLRQKVFLREFQLLPLSKEFLKPFLLFKELIQLFKRSN
jgi:hypothetical protein